MSSALTPYRQSSLQWPLTPEQLQAINDDIENLYRRMNEGVQSGVTDGSYGTASQVPTLAIDDQGKVTSASNTSIAIAATALTSGTLPAARMPALTGDVTSSVGTVSTTLANSGVSAATYGDATHVAQVAVDAKGRVTSASSVAITVGGGLTLITQLAASSSASLDFPTVVSATYDEYLIEIVGLVPATDNVDLLFRVSTDGSTFDGGANYARAVRLDNQAFSTVLGADSGLTSVILAPNLDTTTSQASLSCSIHLFAPGSAALYKQLTLHGTYKNNDGHYYSFAGSGTYLSATATTGFQLILSSGNIASGSVRVYGIAKS